MRPLERPSCDLRATSCDLVAQTPGRRIYGVYEELLVIYDVFYAVIYAVLCCHCDYSMLFLCCHYAVILCCHSMLSFYAVILCCHSMLSLLIGSPPPDFKELKQKKGLQNSIDLLHPECSKVTFLSP